MAAFEKADDSSLTKVSSVDLLITVPNRIVYLLREDKIKLNKIEWLVVDESDKLFEIGERGFRDQLASIYRACSSGKARRALFSATFANDVEEWCKTNLDYVVSVTVGERNTATKAVDQELLYTGKESIMYSRLERTSHPKWLTKSQERKRASSSRFNSW